MPAVLRGFFTSLALFAALVLAQTAMAATPQVLAVHLDNDINPVTAAYVEDQIDRANEDGYNAVVIVLDTPGGLSESMRDIVKKELASDIPVVVYVAPDGARAASAGVWIGQAADILAMAPQTNLGSSTPISIGGEDIQKDLRRKVVNDAAAQLRALAKEHGRNAKWADAAVRVGSNLSAREALRMDVIDVIAPTLPALLDKIDGMKTVPRGLVLETAGADVTEVEMGLWKRILDTLIDPNIIALMLSLGRARDRRRALQPRPGLPRRARRHLPHHRPLRAAGAARQLGRRAADAARSRLLGGGALRDTATARSRWRERCRSSSAPCCSSIPRAIRTRCRCRWRSRSPARSRSSWPSPSRRSSRCGGNPSLSARPASSGRRVSCGAAGSWR